MLHNLLMNNQAELIGDISTDFTYSHEVYGEEFYSATVTIPRLSDIGDQIVTTVSRRLLPDEMYQLGERVRVTGQFRSYNNYTGTGNKLMLTLFAKTIEAAPQQNYTNEVMLTGFVCKTPIYRTTPFGREITDILLAVNRTHNKSDYIPCITWGRNAKYSQTLQVGDCITVTGRMQSRAYQKKITEEQTITKIAYEISVCKIES